MRSEGEELDGPFWEPEESLPAREGNGVGVEWVSVDIEAFVHLSVGESVEATEVVMVLEIFSLELGGAERVYNINILFEYFCFQIDVDGFALCENKGRRLGGAVPVLAREAQAVVVLVSVDDELDHREYEEVESCVRAGIPKSRNIREAILRGGTGLGYFGIGRDSN